MFCLLPVKRLSAHKISLPSLKSLSQRWLPKNPAPPVTKILFIIDVILEYLDLKQLFSLISQAYRPPYLNRFPCHKIDDFLPISSIGNIAYFPKTTLAFRSIPPFSLVRPARKDF